MAHSHNLLRNKNFRFLGNTCLRGGLLCRSAAKARPLFGIGRPQGGYSLQNLQFLLHQYLTAVHPFQPLNLGLSTYSGP
jgi:hypothetical protein